MTIGGGRRIVRNEKDSIWIIWKKTQIFTRKHLSHVFALLLSLGIIVREKSEIFETLKSAHVSWLRIFIVYSIVISLAAGIWRFRSYTLPVSPRMASIMHWIALLLLVLGAGALVRAFTLGHTLPSFNITLLALFIFLLLFILAVGCFWELSRCEPADTSPNRTGGAFTFEQLLNSTKQATIGLKNSIKRAKTFSLVFIAVGILSLILGSHEIKDMLVEAHVHPFRGLILALTFLTVASAFWDFRGDKLTTSPQEVRFLGAIRLLLYELEKFTFGEDRERDIGKRLDAFVADFLEITSNTLCGKKRVDGGLMQLKSEADEQLTLVASSRSAFYDPDLHVPLPGHGKETGPAGVAYDLLNIVYMPFKLWKLGWPFKLVRNGEERYEPSNPNYGWIPSAAPDREHFRSVLCMPVAIHVDKDRKEPLGVLNYSTLALDPFVDRDFMMAECFGSILAQAFAAARREADPSSVSQPRS